MSDLISDAGASTLPHWLDGARCRGLLGQLPDSLVLEVVSGALRVEYPKGVIGLRWDDQPRTGIVLRGSARAFLVSTDGSQVTTRLLQPGDMTGVFAARQPRISRGIEALEDLELLLVDAGRMKQLAMSHPTVAWALVEELTTALNLSQRALFNRALAPVPQRVAIAIMDRARLAGSVFPGMTVSATQSQLADAAGSVREVVARAVHRMRIDGIVEIETGRITILNPDALAALAGDHG